MHQAFSHRVVQDLLDSTGSWRDRGLAFRMTGI